MHFSLKARGQRCLDVMAEVSSVSLGPSARCGPGLMTAELTANVCRETKEVPLT